MGLQSLIGPAVSLVGGIIGGNKKKSAQNDYLAQQQAIGSSRAAADEQFEKNKEGSLWANDQNWLNSLRANDINKEGQLWASDLNKEGQLWANEQDKGNLSWANDQNKQNQLWMNDVNQSNLDKQLSQNRLDWGREGFGGGTFNKDTGRYDINLDPSQKANLDAIRQKQAAGIGAMDTGFNVNGDVMNAYRNLQNPMLQESRDRENARLAAMGLGTGSGTAWESSQRSLNDAQMRGDQSAILAGFEANQALQNNNRSNLATMGNMEGQMLQGMNAPSYAQAGTSSVSAPNVSAPSTSWANITSPNLAPPTITAPNVNYGGAWSNDMSTAAANAQSNANSGWGGLIGSVGGALSSNQGQQAISDVADWFGGL